MREVTRELVLAAADLCGYPPVQIGALTLADEGAWGYALARAVPSERVALLVSLAPELLATTTGGRARLAAPEPLDADDEPLVVGDPEVLPIVRAALSLVPPAVRAAVRREVVFIGVGRSSVAWTGRARFADVVGDVKETVVAIGPHADVLTVLHEIAHAFTASPADEHSQAIPVLGEMALEELAASEGWSDRAAGWRHTSELLADALSLGWWYSQPEAGARPA